MKGTIITIAIDALGTITKGLVQGQKVITGQTSAVLRSARKLRRVPVT